MGTWKELGEVPDSDDEGLDSQDWLVQVKAVAPALPTSRVKDGFRQHHDANSDIWSIPDSSQERESGEAPFPRPQKSPYTLFPSAPVGASTSEQIATGHNVHAPENTGSRSEATANELALKDKDLVDGGATQTCRDSSSVVPQGAGPGIESRPASLEISIPARAPHDLEVLLANHVYDHSGPSLRPRKPIQKHPYLLESARYAKSMKSHGVVPVRLAVEPDRSGAEGEDEDSQEQEFTAQESQLDRTSHIRVDLLSETQSTMAQELARDDDLDELSLSPSPKTSSICQVGRTSSHVSDINQTDDSSVGTEDELPSIEDLVRERRRVDKRNAMLKSNQRRARSVTKQRLNESPKSRPTNIYDLSSSPPQSPSLSRRHRQHPPHRQPNRLPFEAAQAAEPEVHTLSSGDDSESSNGSSIGSGRINSAISPIHANGKIIKGVLPASWLRLDQQKICNGLRERAQKHSLERRPERTTRRGVAIPRQRNNGSSTTPLNSPIDLDEDDNEVEESPAPSYGVRPRPSAIRPELEFASVDMEDILIESDEIDRMLPAKRRRRGSNKARQPKRQRMNSSTFSGRTGQRPRQPKITQVFGPESPMVPASQAAGHPRHKPSATTSPAKACTAPFLSILDFARPEAPNFIKIAARTARARPGLGKAQPSRKCINLGNRKDNLDALSVLWDWEKGRIQPTVGNTLPRTSLSGTRRPLQQLSVNISRSRDAPKHPRVPARQPRIDAFAELHPVSRSPAIKPQKVGLRRPAAVSSVPALLRPAQLESARAAGQAQPAFQAGKRVLDVLYQSRRKDVSTLRDQHVEQGAWDTTRTGDLTETEEAQPQERYQSIPPRLEVAPQRSRFRKQFTPRYVDIFAPKFTHATDPLPSQPLTTAVVETPTLVRNVTTLAGLRPYGARYTQHFEMFPLDAGVFFHESTLVGRGCVCRATDPGFLHKLNQTRPRLTYQLGEQTLRWGPWEATTASELGILLDWLAEQMLVQGEPDSRKMVTAADFLLDYVQTSLSLCEGGEGESFSAKCSEGLANFLGQLESHDGLLVGVELPAAQMRTRRSLEVLIRLFLVAFSGLRVCQGQRTGSLEPARMEEVVARLARHCVRHLLAIGMDDVRTTYDNLQQLSHRERGIRNDQQPIIGWVVLMSVLEQAQLPRLGFWNITYSVLLPPDLHTCSDAAVFEQLWETIFVLLPLSEFNDYGVLVYGLRHTNPTEGWALPQKTLKRVFQLYNAGTRQSPSFNEYCRALVGRCHYLVEQWGWRKCVGVVGIVFDFFGSHDLAHLRNEEIYKSPRFLEELTESAVLTVGPEDRCFHVFIKLLGQVVLRLRQLGQTKDIGNLIARTLPNHNRQYLKENTVSQHDLAALRNHHDLLCTLFWAAPPELRPGVQLIEKLVVPASSHKEACLIGLRAWNQLARFVVASGEGSRAFMPFVAWQNNVFQQVLDQYLSAASDIQRQFVALSSDITQGISRDMVDAMVSTNKAAALDVLRASVVASSDVLKHAPSLEAASLCLNPKQLEQVFIRFGQAPTKLDWSILLAAVEVMEQYLDRLEKALDGQYASDQESAADAHHIEDAVLLLDHSVAKSLLSMTRTMSGLPLETPRSPGNTMRSLCTERAVVVSARLASRFVHSGITNLSQFFTSGKYGLFERAPHLLSLPQRKNLPLFIATLVKNSVFDFKDVGVTILHLWLLSIVKPSQSLAYENYLAETLKHHNLPYLQKAFVPVGIAPDYTANQHYFAVAMASIRRSLQESGGPARQRLRGELAKTLATVMRQMQDDLRSLADDGAAHERYVEFVRIIIGLVKSHGGDICPVDAFFYQMSSAFSPSREDPQLQTAGIVAYGIRVGEGEATAVPQFFYYLSNSLKMAVANNRLDEEERILEKAMESSDALSFMLRRMLPAIVRAVGDAMEAKPWLDVYVGALGRLLTRSCVPREIDESNAVDAVDIVEAILRWLRQVQKQTGPAAGLLHTQLQTMIQLSRLANLVQPVLVLSSCLPAAGLPLTYAARLGGIVDAFSRFVHGALLHLDEILPAAPTLPAGILQTRCLLQGVVDVGESNDFGDGDGDGEGGRNGPSGGGYINSFSKVIVVEARQNWRGSGPKGDEVAAQRVVEVGHVARTVAGPIEILGGGGAAGNSTGQRQSDNLLLSRLHHEVRLWNLKPAKRQTRLARQRALQTFGDTVF